jgi:hypothetical protein
MGLRANISSAHMQPYIESPDQPVGIAPFRLALDDEGLTANHELIAGTRARDFARPQLEGCGLGVDTGFAEADDRVRTPRDHPDRHWVAPSGRIDGIDPEGGERNCRPHWLRMAVASSSAARASSKARRTCATGVALAMNPAARIAPAGERAELLHLGNVGEGLAV